MAKQMIIALVTLFFFSCKKDKSENAPVDINASKVKSIIDANGRSTTMIFNSNGQLIKMYTLYTTGDTGSTVIHEYNGNTLTRTEKYSATDIRIYSYQLNANGWIVSGTPLSNPAAQYTYSYNSNGQITERKMVNGSNIDLYTYFYSNNQCDSIRHTPSWWPAGSYETDVFEYYSDKNDNRNQLFTYFQTHLGKPLCSKAIKSYKTVNYSASNPAGASYPPDLYDYEYDANGRIVKELLHFRSAANVTSSNTYIYY